MTRDWFGRVAKGRGGPGDGFKLDVMGVPKPGPDKVVLAVCGADGARAWTVVSRATLAEDGIMPSLLAELENAQAELRARKEAG